MGKRNPQTSLFQDIKNRDPILAGRFHANIFTAVLCKPFTQLIQTSCKGRKASLLVLCAITGISNADAGIDPSFVDIQSTAVIFDDFERQ
jgi:hypothetical protein